MNLRLLILLPALWLLGAGGPAQAEPGPGLDRIPRAAALQAPGELAALLRDALDDYERLLPRATLMPGSDLDDHLAPVSWHWSARVQAFEARCRQDAAACQPLLSEQLKAMDRGLRQAGEAARSEMGAVIVSAMSDLCQLDTASVAFGACQLSRRSHEAAALWGLLDREVQQVHYQQRYQWQRSQHLSWLKSRGEPPSASTLRDLPELPAWLQARHFEATSGLDAARMAWLVTAVQFAGQADAGFPEVAVHHLARLSWRLRHEEAAQAWSGLLDAQGEPRNCVVRHERLRVEIAKLGVTGGDGLALLSAVDALVGSDCPYTQALVELATDRLQARGLGAPERAALAVSINRALAACDASGACHPVRVIRMRQLAALADGTPRGVAAVSAQVRQTLDRPPVLEADLQLAWAAAAVQSTLPSQKADGLALFQRLQQHLLNMASADMDASMAAQADHSRFDALHRTVASVATEQGVPMSFAQLEALRAQTLLRRLRLESLSHALADVRDAAADEAHAKQLEDARQCQAAVAQVEEVRIAGWRLGVLRQASVLCEQVRETAGLQHLQALARRQAYGDDAAKAWAEELGGMGALDQLALRRASPILQGETGSLAPDEAYLSWLQVPGGYVAMLAEPQFDEVLQVAMPHRSRSLFIPVTDAQASAVTLYRELLMSGGAATRGARRVADKMEGADGLRLKGLPVWLLPGGRFVAQASAPAGAARVRSAREVGQAVHALLMAPIGGVGPRTKRLIISPDGPLSFLPFETLWDGERMLLESVDITYVQSLAVREALGRRAQEQRQRKQPLLSVADPDYSGRASDDPTLPAWMAALRWGPLPGTARESSALLQQQAGARALLGQEASRDQLLAMDQRGQLQDIRVLHFATHGLADAARSALVLSTHQGMRGAYLHDTDITRLRLSSDLVLLSACDTGLGRHQSGEGVMGLPYAFMLAGNTNTVMSLWPVDDEGAALFIPEFMRHAKEGMDLVAALNATKRAFASGQRGERMRDPRIWAAFVQYGVPLTLRAGP